MKQNQLEAKMKKISEHIKKTNLVNTSMKLSKDYGKGKTESYAYHTTSKYKFENEVIKIHLYDGWGMMGGGEIKVFYEDKAVLYGDRDSLGKETSKFNPESEGFCILTYHPGEWEDYIKDTLQIEKEREKKSEEEKKLK